MYAAAARLYLDGLCSAVILKIRFSRILLRPADDFEDLGHE
jgi:hypothetical protein